MRKLATVALALMLCAAAFAADYPLRGMSYIQRGILSAGGADIALTVYVAGGENSAQMVLQGVAGRLAKISADADGNASCEGSAILPQRLAEKFALRDLRIVLGFGGFGNADTVFFGRSGDRLESVSFDGYRAVFGNFKKIGGREIPTKIKIEAESYTLALEFLSTLNTNRNATKQN